MNATRTARKIFGDQLTALEYFFNLKLEGDTEGQRLAHLGVQARANKTLQTSLDHFFDNPLNFARKFPSSDTLFGSVVLTLLATSVKGAIYSYAAGRAPVKQHWMPIAYLHPFGRSAGEGKNNRSVHVPGVSFADGFILNFETRDSTFIHDRVDGNGFYEDCTEYFFHLVENLYSHGRVRKNPETDKTALALFFLVQSVRNPRPGATFHYSKLADVVDAVLVNLDAVGPEMSATIATTSLAMPFTPYVPTFEDNLDGAKVYSLPIGPKVLFSIASKPLKEAQWKQIPKRYRRSVVMRASRRKSVIFGVSFDQIAIILREPV